MYERASLSVHFGSPEQAAVIDGFSQRHGLFHKEGPSPGPVTGDSRSSREQAFFLRAGALQTELQCPRPFLRKESQTDTCSESLLPNAAVADHMGGEDHA